MIYLTLNISQIVYVVKSVIVSNVKEVKCARLARALVLLPALLVLDKVKCVGRVVQRAPAVGVQEIDQSLALHA
jgi:hypothetical protein